MISGQAHGVTSTVHDVMKSSINSVTQSDSNHRNDDNFGNHQNDFNNGNNDKLD